MGKRGPAPKPNALRVLHGERPYRINTAEPQPAEERIEPTQELTEYARAAWDLLAPDLIVKHVLTAWDVHAFTAYCVAAGTFREASEHLTTYGLTGRGAAGGEIKSPYWQIMRDSIDAMVKLGGRFGLTPSDRAQLSIGGGDERASGAERLLS
ncbi:phage terminase small subunit P27 family [Kutzneria albida]|uniref:Phage terminase small subunit P27 family n=1 Tax=Kutzneria albida DSM 43870 TaxID=1449976 RepID=W5WC37_9PSEU|nr:phage terminase small subunit P27 family [Kutzneria albida]AHH98320.1 hypothetical protein KALB_4958 [Kutzneria albida DSM 43870]